MKTFLRIIIAVIGLLPFMTKAQTPAICYEFNDTVTSVLHKYLDEVHPSEPLCCILQSVKIDSVDYVRLDISDYVVNEDFVAAHSNRFLVIGDAKLPVCFDFDNMLYQNEKTYRDKQSRLRKTTFAIREGYYFLIDPRNGRIQKYHDLITNVEK